MNEKEIETIFIEKTQQHLLVDDYNIKDYGEYYQFLDRLIENYEYDDAGDDYTNDEIEDYIDSYAEELAQKIYDNIYLILERRHSVI